MSTMVQRARGRASTRRSIVVILGAAGALAALVTIIHQYAFTGLALDGAAIRHWIDGDGLYAYRAPGTGLGTAVSPAAAYALAPLAVLPPALAGWLMALASLVTLTVALLILTRPMSRRFAWHPYPITAVAVLLALALEPVRAALGLGKWDLLVFGLILADLVALRRSSWARSRAIWWPGRRSAVRQGPLRRFWVSGGWAGAGIGLAAAVAVGPALFIGYLGVTKQWRAFGTALVTASTCAAGALLLAPQETAAWFGEVLWRLDRTGGVAQTGNQSLAGVLARLYHTDTTPILLWGSFALLLVAVGLIRARTAHLDGDEVTAFTLIGLTGAIVGPVTGTHELVWVLPALLIMLDVASRRKVENRRPVRAHGPRHPGLAWCTAAGAVFLLFLAAPIWTFDDLVVRNAYALALILIVNALPWRTNAAPALTGNRWLRA